jgi:hypothetical protein
MRILSALILGMIAMYPFVVSNIYQYAFPSEIYVGSKSTLLLLAITFFLVIIAIVTIFLPDQNRGTAQNEKHKWTLFTVGLIILFISFFSALLFWYSPAFNIFWFKEHTPLAGVISFLILNTISSLVLYFSSQKGSAKRPNLIRILVTLISYVSAVLTLSLALLLLYAFPSETGQVAYPTAASVCFVSYIVWGVLVFQMNREKIKKVS